MKGWYLTSPGKWELLENVPEPVLRDGFVKVEVLTIQESITEANMMSDEEWHKAQFKGKEGPLPLPAHELVCRVIETNPNSKFKIGDRVAALAVAYCGECEACRRGLGQACTHKWRLGGEPYIGGFQERTLLNEKMIIKIDDRISDKAAANLQPASDCVCFIQSMGMKLGDTVAIYGGGCLGMFTMQIAKATGAGQTILVDVKPEILKLAKEYGCTHVINGLEEDPIEKIKELTGGFGADIVVDAAGGNPKRGLSGTKTLTQAIESTRNEGTIFAAAVHGDSVEFPMNKLRMKGKRLCTPIHTEIKYLQRAADLMACGQLRVEEMVTHSFDGIEHFNDMLEITTNKGKYGCLNPCQLVIKK